MAQIELKDVRKNYTLDNALISAVDSVSLDIQKGEFVSIIGHSGSGKTTLLSLMGGILTPTSGQVLYGGTDIYGLGEDELSEYRAEKIGYVFQFASLLPVLTAKENLLLPGLFARDKKDGEKKAEHYLELVGLKDKPNAFPSQLSGGQQRRVAIARSLMNDPAVVLADEPTGDLDEETEAEVIALFKKINSEMGITFVLVTHNTELAMVAGKRLRMVHGKIEEIIST